jgi:cytochrome P450
MRTCKRGARLSIKREFGVSAVRNRLEETVRAEVRHRIGELRGRDRVDLARELALPLPAGVICGWLGFRPATTAS